MDVDISKASSAIKRLGNDIGMLVGIARQLGVDYEELIKSLSPLPVGSESKATSYKENTGFRDRFIGIHRDKDGNVLGKVDTGWRTNTMTNTGFAEIAGLILTDVGGTAFDYTGIGTGAVASDPTDTDLGASVKRKAGTGTRVTTAVANDTAQIVVTFAAADTLSGTDAITESGVFNAGAGNVMACRQVFTALAINWDAGDTFQTTWKIQAKQGA